MTADLLAHSMDETSSVLGPWHHRLASGDTATVELLAGYGITARARADAPGVYSGDAKIASIGIRVRRGGSYPGLALNVNMDLAPFDRINPCGYAGLAMTQIAAFGRQPELESVARAFAPLLIDRLATRS